MRKKIFESKILSNKKIAAGIYRIVLKIDTASADMVAAADMFESAQPGQFINVYLQDKSLLLPRPISICLAEKDQITLVYRVVGKGTKELSAYREGDLLRISTPLGQGYDMDSIFKALDEVHSDVRTIALVAGGLGVPPMLELAKTIYKRLKSINSRPDADGNGNTTIKLIAMIGFQAESYLSEELRSFCNEVHIATESGAAGFHGNVMAMMESEGINADYYLSCGPRPMLKALAEYCGKINKPLQVSLEERMGCGYGACVGCTCKTAEKSDGIVKVKQKKVCKDGPVFFGNEVIWNE